MPTKPRSEDLTLFSNVDLVVYSRRKLDGLVQAFGTSVIVLYCGVYPGRGYKACLELGRYSRKPSPAKTIAGFCTLIEALRGEPAAAWKKATQRIFDVGVTAGRDGPRLSRFAVESGTLSRVAKLKADVVYSIYAHDNARCWKT